MRASNGTTLERLRRHKHRFLRSEIHIRQQVQRLTRLECGDDRLDPFDAPEQTGLSKALAPLQDPGIRRLVGLVGVNRGEAPGQLLGNGSPAGIQSDKVRRKDHRGCVALEFVHGTGQAQALAAQRRISMPEPTPVQPGFGEIAKGLAGRGAHFGLAPIGKTQAQIGQHHAPARTHRSVQKPPQEHTQSAHHRQRQDRRPAQQRQ
jgi:hypothetical protein